MYLRPDQWVKNRHQRGFVRLLTKIMRVRHPNLFRVTSSEPYPPKLIMSNIWEDGTLAVKLVGRLYHKVRQASHRHRRPPATSVPAAADEEDSKTVLEMPAPTFRTEKSRAAHPQHPLSPTSDLPLEAELSALRRSMQASHRDHLRRLSQLSSLLQNQAKSHRPCQGAPEREL